MHPYICTCTYKCVQNTSILTSFHCWKLNAASQGHCRACRGQPSLHAFGCFCSFVLFSFFPHSSWEGNISAATRSPSHLRAAHSIWKAITTWQIGYTIVQRFFLFIYIYSFFFFIMCINEAAAGKWDAAGSGKAVGSLSWATSKTYEGFIIGGGVEGRGTAFRWLTGHLHADTSGSIKEKKRQSCHSICLACTSLPLRAGN